MPMVFVVVVDVSETEREILPNEYMIADDVLAIGSRSEDSLGTSDALPWTTKGFFISRVRGSLVMDRIFLFSTIGRGQGRQ